MPTAINDVALPPTVRGLQRASPTSFCHSILAVEGPQLPYVNYFNCNRRYSENERDNKIKKPKVSSAARGGSSLMVFALGSVGGIHR